LFWFFCIKNIYYLNKQSMENFENIQYTVNEAVATVTLFRPERFNALSRGLLTDIKTAMDKADADPEVRAVILTGSGSKAFCAGADLKDAFMHKEALRPSESLDQFYHPAIKKIRTMEKPVICAVNGLAVGAGASLCMAADYIIAADTASFSVLFVKIGLVPDSGINYMLPRTVGIHKAFELFSTGKSISAQEAKDLGIYNEVVPAELLTSRANELAQFYCNMPTKTIGLIKKLLNSSSHASLDQILALEAEYQDIAIATKDASEGISAFLEKREAKFTGK
jgi:2-(1,2-epoxy-1,2-dihydrophenyl)acetyl-CoA isomerase